MVPQAQHTTHKFRVFLCNFELRSALRSDIWGSNMRSAPLKLCKCIGKYANQVPFPHLAHTLHS